MQGAHGPCDHRWSGVTRRFAGCARSAARRAALLGGRGGGQPCTSQPPLGPSAPCKPRIPKFPIPLPAPSPPCKPRIPKFPIPLPAPSAPCKPRIPKFPIPLPAPSAPCKPRIPKFPIPFPAPSAPCKLRIPKFPIPLPAPSALCKLRIPKFPIPLPAPSALCKPRIPKFPFPIPAPSASCKLAIPWLINATFPQIPKSNPGPKAPKAKRFRIPRVRRLKLHFPPCNHAQPDRSELSAVPQACAPLLRVPPLCILLYPAAATPWLRPSPRACRPAGSPPIQGQGASQRGLSPVACRLRSEVRRLSIVTLTHDSTGREVEISGGWALPPRKTESRFKST